MLRRSSIAAYTGSRGLCGSSGAMGVARETADTRKEREGIRDAEIRAMRFMMHEIETGTMAIEEIGF